MELVVMKPPHPRSACRISGKPIYCDVVFSSVVMGRKEVPSLEVKSQRPLQQQIDTLFQKVGKDFRRSLAEDMHGGQAGQLLHEVVPEKVAEVAVVDDDAFAGVIDDLRREAARIHSLPPHAHAKCNSVGAGFGRPPSSPSATRKENVCPNAPLATRSSSCSP